MNLKKLFHIEDDNLAVPEIRSEEYEDLQEKADREKNEEMEKKDIVYDNVAQNRKMTLAVFRSRALPASED